MTDEYFMMQAIKEAKKALEDDEIPIGAIVVGNERRQSRLQLRQAVVRPGRRPVAEIDDHVRGDVRLGK